jgi:hypothetical protein
MGKIETQPENLKGEVTFEDLNVHQKIILQQFSKV